MPGRRRYQGQINALSVQEDLPFQEGQVPGNWLEMSQRSLALLLARLSGRNALLAPQVPSFHQVQSPRLMEISGDPVP